MADNSSSKGNPAGKRMANPRLKTRRAECWARSQRKKIEHAKENAARAAANKLTRAAGELTPHEIQRAKRRAARDQLRAADLLPPIGTTRHEWVANGKQKVGGKS